MLKTKDAIATLAVKDLKAAAVFYEGALGFEKVAVVDEELIIYRSGNGVFSLYRSKYAGTNKATAILGGGRGSGSHRYGAQGQGRAVRALRPYARHDALWRHPFGRRHEGRVVEGPRRQYPEYCQRLATTTPPVFTSPSRASMACRTSGRRPIAKASSASTNQGAVAEIGGAVAERVYPCFFHG